MSTRSIILVTGADTYAKQHTVRLYKHSDGYPTGNLPVVLEALERALKQGQEHAAKFSEPEPRPVCVSQVVGHLIGAATTVYGMGARIDCDFESDDDNGQGKAACYDATFKPEFLGNQEDLEWIYLVDLNKRTVKIYGGGYTGRAPQDVYKRGTVNPETYAECLREERQDDEIKETRKLVASIEALGFKVNSKQKRGSK